MSIPKTLARDSRIAEVELDGGTGRKYLVHLKRGWIFPNESHTRSFDRVQDVFKAIRPEVLV